MLKAKREEFVVLPKPNVGGVVEVGFCEEAEKPKGLAELVVVAPEKLKPPVVDVVEG